MNKLLITLLLFIAPVFIDAQRAKNIQITAECNEKFCNEYPGIWLPPDYGLTKAGLNRNQQQEWANRFETVANWVKGVYPNPSGCDAYYNADATKSSFGNELKFLQNAELDTVKSNPVVQFNFLLRLFFYYCEGKNEITTRFGSIDQDEFSYCGMSVSFNSLELLLVDKNESSFSNDNRWRIDGRPIRLKLPVSGKWKGYDYCTLQGGQLKDMILQRYVLLARPGMSPFLAVTRKQYLNIAIPYLTKFYDDEITRIDEMPVRSLEEQEATKNKKIEEYKTKYPNNPGMLKQYLATYTTDQEEVKRQKDIILKNKNDDLKKYADALEESKRKGLLESPAIIVQGGTVMVASDQPVFTTEEQGGNMLVTENPNYFKRDLAAAVPQFIVMTWWWKDTPWRLKFRKALEENFPIEKLQAMIDK